VIWVSRVGETCGVDLAKGGAGVAAVAGFGVWLAAIQAKARRKSGARRNVFIAIDCSRDRANMVSRCPDSHEIAFEMAVSSVRFGAGGRASRMDWPTWVRRVLVITDPVMAGMQPVLLSRNRCGEWD